MFFSYLDQTKSKRAFFSKPFNFDYHLILTQMDVNKTKKKYQPSFCKEAKHLHKLVRVILILAIIRKEHLKRIYISLNSLYNAVKKNHPDQCRHHVLFSFSSKKNKKHLTYPHLNRSSQHNPLILNVHSASVSSPRSYQK